MPDSLAAWTLHEGAHWRLLIFGGGRGKSPGQWGETPGALRLCDPVPRVMPSVRRAYLKGMDATSRTVRRGFSNDTGHFSGLG